MTAAAVLDPAAPLVPCSLPPFGTPLFPNVALADNLFGDERNAVTLAVVVLLVGIVATIFARRSGWRVIALAIVTLAFAALAAGWVWQLSTSYSGGCAIYFNADPFSQEQATTLAPLAVVLVSALALAWVIAAVFSVRARRRAA